MLSAEGHAQARDLAARVGAFIGDAPEMRVVSLSLRRVKETVVPATELFGTEVTPRRVWGELVLGGWDGLTGDELYGEKPDKLFRLRGDETFRVSGGKSHVDLYARVHPALGKFMGPSGITVVVIHWGLTMNCTPLVPGIDLLPTWRLDPVPVSIAFFMVIKQGPQVEFINDLGARVTPSESIRPTPAALLGFGMQGMDSHNRDLHCLIVVVKEGGFNRAAGRLLVSQPMFPRQVAKLERGLCIRFLEREPRHVRPTPVEKVLLEHARRTLADWALRHGEILRPGSESRSVLLVGQQTGIGRGPVRRLIDRLGQSCPGWRVESRQISWEDPSAGTRSEQISIGFVWLPVMVADDMEHVMIIEEPIVLAVPEGYESTGRSSLGFAEITTLSPIALPEQTGDLQDSWLAGYVHREPIPVALVAHISNETPEAVTADLGATLLLLGNSVVHVHPGVVFIPVLDLLSARLVPVRRAGDDYEVIVEALQAVQADGALSQRTGMQRSIGRPSKVNAECVHDHLYHEPGPVRLW